MLDRDVTGLKGRARDDAKSAYIHYIPQGHLGNMPLTARETVAYFLKRLDGLSGQQAEVTAAASLGDVGLTAERYRHRRVDQGFSGGEKARVAMATAIARNRPILLADEILAAVDPESTKALLGLFRRIAGRGIAVALIVHQHDLVDYFDRVLVIDDKRLIEDRRNRQPLISVSSQWPKVSDDAPAAERRWPKRLAVGLVLTILAVVFGWWRFQGSASPLAPLHTIPAGAVQASVVGVSDDSTLRAAIPGQSGTATIRLLGVGEPTAPTGAMAGCYRQTTLDGMRRMFPPNQAIYLEQEQIDRDSSGVLPRDVWITGEAGGQADLANEQLVAEGYAVARTSQPVPKYAKWLTQAQRDAQRQDAGVRRACPTPAAVRANQASQARQAAAGPGARAIPTERAIPTAAAPMATAPRSAAPSAGAMPQTTVPPAAQPSQPPATGGGAPIVPGGPPTDTGGAAGAGDIERDPSAWSGGFYRGDSGWCGRPWMAVYGARSKYPSATLDITLSSAPAGAALVLTGMDDELPGHTPIRVTVNGQTIFAGPSPFPNWDGAGQCDNPDWSDATLDIPAGLLQPGDNKIGIADLADSDAFNGPPYVMISDTVLEISG